MKGMLIKDFKLMKNNTRFLILIIFISIACAAGMQNSFFALGYATAIISVFSINTIAYDEYDNGMAYLFSLPVSRKLYVKEKYAFAILVTAIGMTIATLISIVVSFFLDEQNALTEWIGIISLSIFFVLFIQSIVVPVRMKFDTEKHKMAMLIVFAAIAAVAGSAYALAGMIGIDLDTMLDAVLISKAWQTLGVVIVLGVVMMLISYKISVRFMEKREF